MARKRRQPRTPAEAQLYYVDGWRQDVNGYWYAPDDLAALEAENAAQQAADERLALRDDPAA